MTLLRDPLFENMFRQFVGELCKGVFWGADASVSREASQGAKQDIVNILETDVKILENWKNNKTKLSNILYIQ